MNNLPVPEVEVREIMATILGVDKGLLTAHSSANDLEQWDSMRHLHLIFALEEKFEVEFDEQEIGELSSLSLILDALNRKHGID